MGSPHPIGCPPPGGVCKVAGPVAAAAAASPTSCRGRRGRRSARPVSISTDQTQEAQTFRCRGLTQRSQ
eukprot:7219462-Pyramimonas_sp.AAC.1